MTDFGHVELDKSTTELEYEASRTRGRFVVMLAILVLLAAAGGYYFMLRRGSSPQLTTDQPAGAASKAAPVAEPGDNMTLPPLDETDPLVRELVRALSSHPTIAAWLATDQLIQNFTVVTLNVSNGQTPVRQLKALAPTSGFQVTGSGKTIYLDPKSYERYDTYADAVASLDARGTARLYATLTPRIVEASRTLGFPDGSFDPVLERAMAQLLAAPIVKGSVKLEPLIVSFAFADPRLEGLSAAQRHFLRMGPRNMGVIQAKLREIAQHLGIPDSRLPPPGPGAG